MGPQGPAGEVPTEWLTTTTTRFDDYARYSAAYSAIQIHLPQDHGSRLTASTARSHGQQGYGLGYAYKFDDRDDGLAATVGIGTSGGEEVWVASLGFEFGGDRHLQSRSNDLQSRRVADLEARLSDLEQALQREREITREELERCQQDVARHDEASERMFEHCVRK
jgi:hypothetical protein